MKSVLLLVLLGVTATFATFCERVVPITSNFTIGRGVLLGPESVDVDSQGFLYTSVNDGSIRRINPNNPTEITTYAYTVPTLTPEQRANCGQLAFESTCGRALGIKFDKNDNLYVADAYKGLLLIPRNNVANVQVLSTSSEGVAFKFTNALVINKAETAIYFTDTSPTDPRTSFVKVLLQALPVGRLLKYDMITKQTTTLIRDLVFGNGVAFDEDEEVVVINETTLKRMRRFYITGRKAGTNDIFNEDLSCYPDNVEYDPISAKFLVGCYGEANQIIDFAVANPALSALLVANVPPIQVLGLIPPRGVIKVVDERGKVQKTLYDATGVNVQRTAEAKRVGDYIYVGSVLNPYLNRLPASLLTQRGDLECNFNF